MDGNTKAIAEALRRWHEAPTAEIIDLAEVRRQRERERSDDWMRRFTRTMPEGPEAA